ncbi:MAG: acetolactate decarboxylase [Kiritimatiellales bacterium]|jgi:acetolactate decarboxylase
MKGWGVLFLLLAALAAAETNTLTQVSTIDALLAGAYDGQMTLGELLKHGDLGIGTFDALEGEMIVIDHKVYQARADGTVRLMPDNTTTPFAAVVDFRADQISDRDSQATYSGLQARIDELAPNKNLFVAIRFDGKFPSMKVRSVPKQQKPYPPLAEVTQHQAVFEYTNVTGTVIGFRCPEFVKGVNVPGYHLHFISKDRKLGGHILNFTAIGGALQIDTCNRFYMVLPEDGRLRTVDLSKDRSKELEKVEK